MTEPEPVDVAKRLLDAIVWGEHITVWEILSPAGRDYVLEAGRRRGLDAVQASRLSKGTSPVDERDSFLTGLLRGLRVDFSSVDLENVSPSGEVVELDDQRCEVLLDSPATFAEHRWAAGSIVLSKHPASDAGFEWLVDRVNPLVSRSE